ncbi:MAG: hypothetical protein WCX61_03460 [Candidatus Peribacteraceae bacterium]
MDTHKHSSQERRLLHFAAASSVPEAPQSAPEAAEKQTDAVMALVKFKEKIQEDIDRAIAFAESIDQEHEGAGDAFAQSQSEKVQPILQQLQGLDVSLDAQRLHEQMTEVYEQAYAEIQKVDTATREEFDKIKNPYEAVRVKDNTYTLHVSPTEHVVFNVVYPVSEQVYENCRWVSKNTGKWQQMPFEFRDPSTIAIEGSGVRVEKSYDAKTKKHVYTVQVQEGLERHVRVYSCTRQKEYELTELNYDASPESLGLNQQSATDLIGRAVKGRRHEEELKATEESTRREEQASAEKKLVTVNEAMGLIPEAEAHTDLLRKFLKKATIQKNITFLLDADSVQRIEDTKMLLEQMAQKGGALAVEGDDVNNLFNKKVEALQSMLNRYEQAKEAAEKSPEGLLWKMKQELAKVPEMFKQGGPRAVKQHLNGLNSLLDEYLKADSKADINALVAPYASLKKGKRKTFRVTVDADGFKLEKVDAKVPVAPAAAPTKSPAAAPAAAPATTPAAPTTPAKAPAAGPAAPTEKPETAVEKAEKQKLWNAVHKLANEIRTEVRAKKAETPKTWLEGKVAALNAAYDAYRVHDYYELHPANFAEEMNKYLTGEVSLSFDRTDYQFRVSFAESAPKAKEAAENREWEKKFEEKRQKFIDAVNENKKIAEVQNAAKELNEAIRAVTWWKNKEDIEARTRGALAEVESVLPRSYKVEAVRRATDSQLQVEVKPIAPEQAEGVPEEESPELQPALAALNRAVEALEKIMQEQDDETDANATKESLQKAIDAVNEAHGITSSIELRGVDTEAPQFNGDGLAPWFDTTLRVKYNPVERVLELVEAPTPKKPEASDWLPKLKGAWANDVLPVLKGTKKHTVDKVPGLWKQGIDGIKNGADAMVKRIQSFFSAPEKADNQSKSVEPVKTDETGWKAALKRVRKSTVDRVPGLWKQGKDGVTNGVKKGVEAVNGWWNSETPKKPNNEGVREGSLEDSTEKEQELQQALEALKKIIYEQDNAEDGNANMDSLDAAIQKVNVAHGELLSTGKQDVGINKQAPEFNGNGVTPWFDQSLRVRYVSNDFGNSGLQVLFFDPAYDNGEPAETKKPLPAPPVIPPEKNR